MSSARPLAKSSRHRAKAFNGEKASNRGEADGGDLSFATDLREEKGTERRHEHTRAADLLIVAVIPVRQQSPHSDAEKRNSEDPAHPRAAQQAAEERAGSAGGGMVCERREEDSEDDRQRTLKARCEHKDRICVLSPISARPTTAVETRKASTGMPRGPGER
jgi:hypothetical protein